MSSCNGSGDVQLRALLLSVCRGTQLQSRRIRVPAGLQVAHLGTAHLQVPLHLHGDRVHHADGKEEFLGRQEQRGGGQQRDSHLQLPLGSDPS